MENSKKAYKNPIRAAIASLLIGMVMRILHWPFSKGIIFISFAAILILYALRFFKKEEKKSVDLIKMALVLFWTTNGLLTILDFTHTLFFQIGTAFTFIAWFAMEGTSYFMSKEGDAKNSITEIIWNGYWRVNPYMRWSYALTKLGILDTNADLRSYHCNQLYPKGYFYCTKKEQGRHK